MLSSRITQLFTILHTWSFSLWTHLAIQCNGCTNAKQLFSNNGVDMMIARSSSSYVDSEAIHPWKALDRIFLFVRLPSSAPAFLTYISWGNSGSSCCNASVCHNNYVLILTTYCMSNSSQNRPLCVTLSAVFIHCRQALAKSINRMSDKLLNIKWMLIPDLRTQHGEQNVNTKVWLGCHHVIWSRIKVSDVKTMDGEPPPNLRTRQVPLHSTVCLARCHFTWMCDFHSVEWRMCRVWH